VETFLGKLGNKGLGFMANPCERVAYILSKFVFLKDGKSEFEWRIKNTKEFYLGLRPKFTLLTQGDDIVSLF
jgi:hypothetical protein